MTHKVRIKSDLLIKNKQQQIEQIYSNVLFLKVLINGSVNPPPTHTQILYKHPLFDKPNLSQHKMWQ